MDEVGGMINDLTTNKVVWDIRLADIEMTQEASSVAGKVVCVVSK